MHYDYAMFIASDVKHGSAILEDACATDRRIGIKSKTDSAQGPYSQNGHSMKIFDL
jgi:hypothetical protein